MQMLAKRILWLGMAIAVLGALAPRAAYPATA
jgi:hypothetical protein